MHKGGPNHVRNNVDGLADIVSGEGNLAARVNAAQGMIKNYLAGSKALNTEDLDHQSSKKHLKSVTHRKGFSLHLPVSPTGAKPAHQNTPTQNLSSNFMSGINRTDFTKEAGVFDNPGPGSYQVQDQTSITKVKKGPNAFQNASSRDTQAFLFRNGASPFKNATNVYSPTADNY